MAGLDLLTKIDAPPVPYFPGDMSAGSRNGAYNDRASDPGFDEVLSGTIKSSAERRNANERREVQPQNTTGDGPTKPSPSNKHADGSPEQPPAHDTVDDVSNRENSGSRAETAASTSPGSPHDADNDDCVETESSDEETFVAAAIAGGAPQQFVQGLIASNVASQPISSDPGATISDPLPARGFAPSTESPNADGSLNDAPLITPAGLLPALQAAGDSINQRPEVPGFDAPSRRTETEAPIETVVKTVTVPTVDMSAVVDDAESPTPLSEESPDPVLTQKEQQSEAPPQIAIQNTVQEVIDSAEIELPDQSSHTTAASPASENSETRTARSELPVADATKPDNTPARSAEAFSPISVSDDATDDVRADVTLPEVTDSEQTIETTAVAEHPPHAAAAGKSHPYEASPAQVGETRHEPLPAVSEVDGPSDESLLAQDDPQLDTRDTPQGLNASPAALRTSEPGAAQSRSMPAPPHATHVVQQAAQGIQFAHRNGGEMQVRLSPPELGALQIEISIRDGLVSARLETHSAAAQQLLSDNLHQLKESLSQQGLVVDRLDVFMGQQQSGGDFARQGDGQNPREPAPELPGFTQQSSRKPATTDAQRGAWSIDRSLTRGPLRQLDVTV